MPALLFVLGFATVFVALGATASVAGQLLRDHMTLLAQVAGVAIILMGLHFIGVFRLGLLNREFRYMQAKRPVGPRLAPTVLALLSRLAGRRASGRCLPSSWRSRRPRTACPAVHVLLAVYSAGLGVPFLAAALGIERFLGFLQRFRRHLGTVERVTGALLVVTGVIVPYRHHPDHGLLAAGSLPGPGAARVTLASADGGLRFANPPYIHWGDSGYSGPWPIRSFMKSQHSCWSPPS
jgi:cytochrome c-type biogenesis protein